MFRYPAQYLILVTLLTGTPACGNRDDPAPTHKLHGLTETQQGEVLARIGDRVITVGEFADKLARESPYIRPRYNNPENRKDYLRNWVDFELLALEAKRSGLDDLPEVRRIRDQKVVEAFLEDRVYRRIRASDVSEDEIRARYEANPQEFHQPEQRRADHIVVQEESRALHLIERLENADDRDTAFRELVSRFSVDATTRDRLGDLRFFSKVGDLTIPAPVREATFAIAKVGELYPRPVASEEGFHVIRLRAVRPALERSVEDARRIIQSQLLREKHEAAINALVAELRDAAQITIHQEQLDALRDELVSQAGQHPSRGRDETPEGQPSPFANDSRERPTDGLSMH